MRQGCRHWALWLALAVVAARAEVPSDEPIVRAHGVCQFLLVHYPLAAPDEAEINVLVARELAQHQQLFQFKVPANFHVRVRIFGRYEDYERFALTNRQVNGTSLNTGSMTNIAGYYSQASREVVTWRQNPASYLANNILHEASHAIMFAQFRRIPPWLSEGCATYFAFPRFMQDSDDVNSLAFRWAKLSLWQREGALPELKTFLNLNDASWHRLQLDKAYTVSWSLFQLLMASPQNQDVLRRLFNQLQRPDLWHADCASLLDQDYPGGLKRLETHWHNWIALTSPKILGPSMDQVLEHLRTAKD